MWVYTVHLIQGWDWKGISHWPYQLLIRKNHLRIIKHFILKIIEKPGHGHMRQTQCHICSLGRRDNIIYLHDSVIGSIKWGSGKLIFTTMQPEPWLVEVSWIIEGRESFATIPQVGLSLRWTQKYTSLILQQSWADNKKQKCIMG